MRELAPVVARRLASIHRSIGPVVGSADLRGRASQRIGSEPDVARTISLSELGFVAEQRGDPAAARSLHLQCLTAARKLGDPQAVAQALTGLAGAQALSGQPDRAAQPLGAADTVRRSAGAIPPSSDSADINRITAATRRALGEAAFGTGFQNGRRLRPEQAASRLRNGPRAPRHICMICT
jgi:Tetratricopeptide repeat